MSLLCRNYGHQWIEVGGSRHCTRCGEIDDGGPRLVVWLLLSAALCIFCMASCVPALASGTRESGKREGVEYGPHLHADPSGVARENHGATGAFTSRSRMLWLGGSPPPNASRMARPVALSALAEIESGNNPAAVGRAGERGRFQMSRAAWVESGRLIGCRCAFRTMAHTAHADAHAAAYWQHLEAFLAAHKRPTTCLNLYLAYNLGPRGFAVRGFSFNRCPAVTRDTALRFARLLESIQDRAGGNLARQ